MSDTDTDDTEQTLRKLHRRFTTLEGAVESAVNDLRADSRPGDKEREIANALEAALEGTGRYSDTETEQWVSIHRPLNQTVESAITQSANECQPIQAALQAKEHTSSAPTVKPITG